MRHSAQDSSLSSGQAIRVLVTGAGGFAGAGIALALNRAGFSVFSHVGRGGESGGADLTSEADVARLLKGASPDVIVHTAALSSSDACERERDEAFRVNVGATMHLVQQASRRFAGLQTHRPPYFIHLSTDLVFDGGVAPRGGFTERDEVRARSVYGLSKLESEQIVLGSSLERTVLRLSLLYGRSPSARQGFLGWMDGGIRTGGPVRLFVDEWRTPLLLSDLSEVVRRLVVAWGEGRLTADSELLHVAGSERLSRHAFGVRYCEHFGLSQDAIIGVRQADVASVAPRSPDVSLSNEKLQRVLGYRPATVENGLKLL